MPGFYRLQCGEHRQSRPGAAVSPPQVFETESHSMPYRPLLARIQKLFRSGADPHFKSIEDGFKSGRLELPAQPMTDLDLARAIREFQAKPVSDWAVRKPDVALRAPERLQGR